MKNANKVDTTNLHITVGIPNLLDCLFKTKDRLENEGNYFNNYICSLIHRVTARYDNRRELENYLLPIISNGLGKGNSTLGFYLMKKNLFSCHTTWEQDTTLTNTARICWIDRIIYNLTYKPY